MCKVAFVNPDSHKKDQKLSSVGDITSVSAQEEKAKKKEQQQKYRDGCIERNFI